MAWSLGRLTSGASGWPKESALSLVGNLADLELGDIFQIVSLSRRSGTLQLTTPVSSGEILFERGKVVAASRTDQDQAVGEYLLHEGVISPTSFQEMLAAQRAGRNALELFESFDVSRQRVVEALEVLLRHTVYAMLDWREGTFSFVLDDHPDPWCGFALDSTRAVSEPGLNPQYLAMEGARLRDEQGKDDTLDSFLSRSTPANGAEQGAVESPSEAPTSCADATDGPDEVDFGSVAESVAAVSDAGDEPLPSGNPACPPAVESASGQAGTSEETPAPSSLEADLPRGVDEPPGAEQAEPPRSDKVIPFPTAIAHRGRGVAAVALADEQPCEADPETVAGTEAEGGAPTGAGAQADEDARTAVADEDAVGSSSAVAATPDELACSDGNSDPVDTSAAGGGWRFLVVDDDPQVTGTVAASMAAQGAAVETYGTVADALGRLQEPLGSVVVVCDLIIARSDGRGILGGIEILERVRELSSDSPFILFTDYQNREAEARAQSLGIRAVLTKPRKAQIHVQGDTETVTSPMRDFLARLSAEVEPYLSREEAPPAPSHPTSCTQPESASESSPVCPPAGEPASEEDGSSLADAVATAPQSQASEVPVSEVPVSEVPVSEVPVSEVPVSEIPVSEIPASEIPASEVPVSEIPASEIPASEIPVSEIPASEASAPETPVCEVPASDSTAAAEVPPNPTVGELGESSEQDQPSAADPEAGSVGTEELFDGPLPSQPSTPGDAVAPTAAAAGGGEGLFDLRSEIEVDVEEALEPYAADLPPALISVGEMHFLRSMIAELRDPRNRDQVTLLVLRFAAAVVERAVLFLVTRRAYVGLGGFSPEEDTDAFVARVRMTQIPVEADSVFHKVSRFRTMVRTELVRNDGNERLIDGLGGAWPQGEVVAAPLISGDRVAAVVYGDNLSGRALGATDSLEVFLQQAGLVMERMLLERRLEHSRRKGRE